MTAQEAKQIADSLNQDNTAEFDTIIQQITEAVYAGKYYVDPQVILSNKTCTQLGELGYLVQTSPGMMRVSWEAVGN